MGANNRLGVYLSNTTFATLVGLVCPWWVENFYRTITEDHSRAYNASVDASTPDDPMNSSSSTTPPLPPGKLNHASSSSREAMELNIFPLDELSNTNLKQFQHLEHGRSFDNVPTLISDGELLISAGPLLMLAKASQKDSLYPYPAVDESPAHYGRNINGMSSADNSCVSFTDPESKNIFYYFTAQQAWNVLRTRASPDLHARFNRFLAVFRRGGSGKKRSTSNFSPETPISSGGSENSTNDGNSSIRQSKRRKNLSSETPSPTPTTNLYQSNPHFGGNNNNSNFLNNNTAPQPPGSIPNRLYPFPSLNSLPPLSYELEQMKEMVDDVLKDPTCRGFFAEALLDHEYATCVLGPKLRQLYEVSVPTQLAMLQYLRHGCLLSNESMHGFSDLAKSLSEVYCPKPFVNGDMFARMNRKIYNDDLSLAKRGKHPRTDLPKWALGGPQEACPMDEPRVETLKVKGKDKKYIIVEVDLIEAILTFYRDPKRRKLVKDGKIKYIFNFDNGVVASSTANQEDRSSTHLSISFAGMGALNHSSRSCILLKLATAKDNAEVFRAMNCMKTIEILDGLKLDISGGYGKEQIVEFECLSFTLDYVAMQSVTGRSSLGTTSSKFFDLIHSNCPRSLMREMNGDFMTFWPFMNIDSDFVRSLDDDLLEAHGFKMKPELKLVMDMVWHGPLHCLARSFNQFIGRICDFIHHISGAASVSSLQKALQKRIKAPAEETRGIGMCLKLGIGRFNKRYCVMQYGEFRSRPSLSDDIGILPGSSTINSLRSAVKSFMSPWDQL